MIQEAYYSILNNKPFMVFYSKILEPNNECIMLNILVLILFATTLLTAHPIELDRRSDAALLSEDNFITKYHYRMTLKWTLFEFNTELSLAETYAYEKYEDCRIEDEKMLKHCIKVTFNGVNDWRYMQFIKEKLLSKVTKGIKVGVLLREWKDLLLDRAMDIDSFMIEEPDLSGRGERWKLGYKEMSLNRHRVSLSSIIPIDALNKRDVLFVEHEAAYREEVETWHEWESGRLYSNSKGNRYVLKERLLEKKEKIEASSNIPFLEGLREEMLDSILLGLEDEVLEDTEFRNRIKKELDRVEDKYLAKKDDSLRFVYPFFEEVYKEGGLVDFSFPQYFSNWFYAALVYERPEQLLQDYQEILFTWKNYHTGTIKLFVDELTKEKRNSSQYYLSRTKLTENISKYFDKTKIENDIPSDFFLIEKLLLKGLPRQEKISLKELAVFWQEFLDTSITEQLIEDHFRKHYTEYNELEWIDFLIDLLPSMPTSIELVEWLQESKFD
jgi:hypothetical protein